MNLKKMVIEKPFYEREYIWTGKLRGYFINVKQNLKENYFWFVVMDKNDKVVIESDKINNGKFKTAELAGSAAGKWISNNVNAKSKNSTRDLLAKYKELIGHFKVLYRFVNDSDRYIEKRVLLSKLHAILRSLGDIDKYKNND